jgi:hypothetical protein
MLVSAGFWKDMEFCAENRDSHYVCIWTFVIFFKDRGAQRIGNI